MTQNPDEPLQLNDEAIHARYVDPEVRRASYAGVQGREHFRYPSNLRAMEHYDDDELVDALHDVQEFVDAIREQSRNHRHVLALVLRHGKATEPAGSNPERVAATALQIRDEAKLPEGELEERAEHLQKSGLLDIDVDEYPPQFVLRDPTAYRVGWDLFNSLKAISHTNPRAVKRAILDLDFTVFDG